MVDPDLILRRLAFLETYLDQLAPYREIDLAAYQQDWKMQLKAFAPAMISGAAEEKSIGKPAANKPI